MKNNRVKFIKYNEQEYYNGTLQGLRHFQSYDYYDTGGQNIYKVTYKNNNIDDSIVNSYDKNGNLVQKTFLLNNRITKKFIYEYNQDNNLISTSKLDWTGQIIVKQFNEYYSKNRIKEVSIINNGVDSTIISYDYSIWGNLKTITTDIKYNKKASHFEKIETDKNDNIVLAEWYYYNPISSKDMLYGKEIHIFDNENNLLEDAFYKNETGLVWRHEYTYDKNKLLLEIKDFNSSNKLEKITQEEYTYY